VSAPSPPSGPALPAPLLVGMMLATALAPLGSTMIAVALPSIGADIGADVGALTPWLVSSYLVASIALQSPGGKAGDLLGHGRALLAGLGLVAIGSLIGSVATGLPLLGLARILTAAGGAATVPATMAILRNRTPAERRARVFGLFGACMGLAAAVGPLAGGELTERIGWRAIFAANLPVVALSLGLVLAGRGVEHGARAQGVARTFDWIGTALLAGGLTAVVIALRLAGVAAIGTGVLGAVLLAVFPVWERRPVSPILDMALVARRPFLAGGSIVALQNMAMYPLLFQLPVFFDRVRGLGPLTMGRALLALTLAMMAASLAGGRLTETIGPRAQVLGGSFLALAGLWWFHDLGAVHAPDQIVPGLLLVGIGIGLTSPPSQAVAMSAVEAHQSGMAGGILSTLRYLGGVAGTTALAALLVRSDDPASHQRPVLVYAGALLAATVLATALPAAIAKREDS
jgi:MFS family permease